MIIHLPSSSRPAGRSPRANRRARGMMIAECLFYLTLWLILMIGAFAVFYKSWDTSHALRQTLDDMSLTLRAGERWRDDVRSASGPLRAESLPGSQLVHIPVTSGEIVWRFSDGAVSRQAGPNAAWMQILPGVKSSRMEPDARRLVTPWRWEIELTPHRQSVRLQPLFTFEAVPKTAANR